jgi:DNA-binding CsgD family transcriptional regulator
VKKVITNFEQEIANYGSVLKHFEKSKISELKDVIIDLKLFGVSAYAERIIDSKGNSIKFCNNLKWSVLEKEQKFFHDFSAQISSEVLNNFKLKNKIITRSGDKTFNDFLKRLEFEGLNSSVIVNDFHKDCITISYFMIDPSNPVNRDMVLNNLKTIESIRLNMQKYLIKLFESNDFSENKKALLDKKVRDLIFKSLSENRIKLNWKNRISFLTQRECDCLNILSKGLSNKLIASELQISAETVKFHFNNIKIKTNANCRNELIQIATILPKITN